jgi:hypothetical protein
MSERSSGPPPKTSETEPPAADRPTDERGPVVGGAPEPAHGDSRGRAANDPSMSSPGMPESPQVPPGKPDGEVDTRGG